MRIGVHVCANAAPEGSGSSRRKLPPASAVRVGDMRREILVLASWAAGFGCRSAPATPGPVRPTASASDPVPAADPEPEGKDPAARGTDDPDGVAGRTVVLPLEVPVEVGPGTELVLTSFIIERIEPPPFSDEPGGETTASLGFELRGGDDPLQLEITYASTPQNPSGLPVTGSLGERLQLRLVSVDAGNNPKATVELIATNPPR